MTIAATSFTPLNQWLRLLWNFAPPVQLDSQQPFIQAGAIHLPASAHWRHHCAAAAHAAAHLVYSPARFDGAGLVPIARTLLATLEDARVEALAMRDLPGLARLWRSLHQASPDDGNGFEALLHRLARALADPGYSDPHPWVQKGRRLLFVDQDLLVLCKPGELRSAAMQLGHDIGQMRLPFNARGYRPAPAYRDDHRWMWDADRQESAQPPPAPQPVAAGAPPDDDDDTVALDATITWQPEWDRLINRLRPDWCRVIEQPAPAATATAAEADVLPTSRLCEVPLRRLLQPRSRASLSRDGERLDLDALVQWYTARRSHHSPEGRVYRSRAVDTGRATVVLLIDQSASTAAREGIDNGTLLQASTRVAWATAQALRRLDVPCMIVAFHSSGRLAVQLRVLKSLADPVDADLAARLGSLRSGGSTRLGAALRHLTERLAAARPGQRLLLLLSDGEPHDIDIHDPRYLVEDARQAVRAAARRAVRTACLTTGQHIAADARRIFGRDAVRGLGALDELPRALRQLLG